MNRRKNKHEIFMAVSMEIPLERIMKVVMRQGRVVSISFASTGIVT